MMARCINVVRGSPFDKLRKLTMREGWGFAEESGSGTAVINPALMVSLSNHAQRCCR
ncbi:protein of unknown function [Nitratireductor aquimarinus]